MYMIRIYDREWRIICHTYKRFDDRQQAELRAKKDCDRFGGEHWDVTRIR